MVCGGGKTSDESAGVVVVVVERENCVNWRLKETFLRWKVRMIPKHKPKAKNRIRERRFARCNGALKSLKSEII